MTEAWVQSLFDEEPEEYGPKARDYTKEAPATAKWLDARNAIRAEVGLSSLSPSSGLPNPLGAPPLDWWNVSEEEVRRRLILSMCPERVCRTCGEPSRRIVNTRSGTNRQPALAAHIKERREAVGLTSAEINGWFGFKEIAKNWERVDQWGAAIPSAEVWPTLKERLGLSDEFDEMIYGGNQAEYLTEDGHALASGERRVNYDRGDGPDRKSYRIEAVRKAPDSFTDCGHDDWRPGVVLDPFAGSGAS